MADDPDVARERSDQKEIVHSFRIAELRAKRIHDNVVDLSSAFELYWFDAVAAVFCLFLGWRWNSYIIGVLVFCLYWVLRRILHSILGSHLLLVCVHQQLMYLAQRRQDLDRETTDDMQYVLEQYARHCESMGWHNLGWRYALADMLQTRLREEGLSPGHVSDEGERYFTTIDPNYRRGSGGLKGPTPYSDKDLGL